MTKTSCNSEVKPVLTTYFSSYLFFCYLFPAGNVFLSFVLPIELTVKHLSYKGEQNIKSTFLANMRCVAFVVCRR